MTYLQIHSKCLLIHERGSSFVHRFDIPIIPSHSSKPFGKVPNTPIMMGATLTVLHFQIGIISRFRFSIFSFSLMFTLVSKGQATSKIRNVLSSLFNTTISGLLCSRGLIGSWLHHFAPLSKSYLFQNCQWLICARASKAGIGSEPTSYIPPNMAD